jgi:hypothetical protein
MRIAILLLAIVAVATSRASLAACVVDDYSVEAEYDRSVTVVVAKVVSDAKIPNYELSDSCWSFAYTLKIKELFRGSSAKTAEVFGDNGRGCFPLTKGKTYVLFLYEELGRVSVDPCGNSGLVSQKHGVVTRLRALKTTSNAGRKPNYWLKLPVRPVTGLACARTAPARPAA